MGRGNFLGGLAWMRSCRDGAARGWRAGKHGGGAPVGEESGRGRWDAGCLGWTEKRKRGRSNWIILERFVNGDTRIALTHASTHTKWTHHKQLYHATATSLNHQRRERGQEKEGNQEDCTRAGRFQRKTYRAPISHTENSK
jgi:hypothetical protein